MGDEYGYFCDKLSDVSRSLLKMRTHYKEWRSLWFDHRTSNMTEHRPQCYVHYCQFKTPNAKRDVFDNTSQGTIYFHRVDGLDTHKSLLRKWPNNLSNSTDHSSWYNKFIKKCLGGEGFEAKWHLFSWLLTVKGPTNESTTSVKGKKHERTKEFDQKRRKKKERRWKYHRH